ncbi:HLH domain-containing protein [Histomonas meleagridis]|uniref:HLH domain-containing protein n=1 Tax=Histomonas meleagridis TaxID=135588 RepID=UPI003559CA9D|nr:HLH domain-containing protein [Histomonas meleagridis]KAH0805374.1 HLH domain-containing protein [Histomonas meleagridis]
MRRFVAEGKIFDRISKSVCEGPIPEDWVQPFFFKASSNLLYQNRSGPCGLFAAVQSYIHIYTKNRTDIENSVLLLNAILEIMDNIRHAYVICTNVDHANHRVEWYATNDRSMAAEYINTNKWLSESNATILFIYSIAILVGPVWLNHFSMGEPFITNDGNTNLTFVLLLISGEILDSYNDGFETDSGMVIKGATKPQRVGFVSNNQEMQAVGNFFKNPTEGIWIAFNGVHFTTIVKMSSGVFLQVDSLSHYSYFNPVVSTNVYYSQLVHGRP